VSLFLEIRFREHAHLRIVFNDQDHGHGNTQSLKARPSTLELNVGADLWFPRRRDGSGRSRPLARRSRKRSTRSRTILMLPGRIETRDPSVTNVMARNVRASSPRRGPTGAHNQGLIRPPIMGLEFSGRGA
jgi:hypothetical protein